MAMQWRISFPSFLCLIVASSVALSNAGSVTYDDRAIVIDGKRRVLISGSIHYPRSTPEMWPDLIAKAKDGGVDVIETYVFWNAHEPVQGTYTFEGRLDLVRFVTSVKQAGLLANLRIGPYVCAEWNYGGFPVWLRYIPGIEFRTDNEPFKYQMQKFTSYIVELMKEQQLFYWQGGPIILAQIENEYGNVIYEYGAAGKSYLQWAAQMAVGLNTGVPWIMCKEPDAPDPIINTCNGFYCDAFIPNSNRKPKMWTENWTGWFTKFGGLKSHRPAEDIAFAVARFFERGGTFQNYYMYHGGTNFGRTAGGPFITTSYDYDAPLDEYGNIRQPKWGHLKALHQSIKLCEPALILGGPNWFSLGSKQEGHIYTNGGDICAAFLANYDSQNDATVYFNHQPYSLPAWSVSILPDCKNVVFNTAKVSVQTSTMVMKSTNLMPMQQSASMAAEPDGSLLSNQEWASYNEPVGVWGSNSFTALRFLNQIDTTGDKTDYLWYITSIQVNDAVLQNSKSTYLSLHSLGHAMHVFINGKYSGSGYGNPTNSQFQLNIPIELTSGENKIALLSMTVGLQNVGSFFETWGAGLDGAVTIEGLQSGTQNLAPQTWTYQIGLQGEQLGLYSEMADMNTEWISGGAPPIHTPLTWYKTAFNSPAGIGPISLDLISMSKGQAWVNGESLGRYWTTRLSPQTGCSTTCDYRGLYHESKCATNCGQPTQRWYHVPRSWLKPSGNLLVLFEEVGGDPTAISFGTPSLETVCAHVSQSHLPPVNTWTVAKVLKKKFVKPEVRLQCGSGQNISSISFASFGNPEGLCGSFRRGSCHAGRSIDALRKACIGKRKCSVRVSRKSFDKDPCPGIVKSLAVEAICS